MGLEKMEKTKQVMCFNFIVLLWQEFNRHVRHVRYYHLCNLYWMNILKKYFVCYKEIILIMLYQN